MEKGRGYFVARLAVCMLGGAALMALVAGLLIGGLMLIDEFGALGLLMDAAAIGLLVGAMACFADHEANTAEEAAPTKEPTNVR